MPDNSSQAHIVSTLVQDDPSFADLVEEFVNGLDDRVSAMRKAIEDNELARLKTLAHQLKGAGGGHGYPVLTQASAALEERAAHRSLEECKTALEELASFVSRVAVSA